MTKKSLIGIVFAVVLATVQLNAQDLVHYKQIVKELSSSKYQEPTKQGNTLQKSLPKQALTRSSVSHSHWISTPSRER